jgi:hypothetical protein
VGIQVVVGPMLGLIEAERSGLPAGRQSWDARDEMLVRLDGSERRAAPDIAQTELARGGEGQPR